MKFTKHYPLHFFTDLQNKTMTIEMTIKVNTTSASYTVTATEMLTCEFSNLHQTTNGVFVQQTNSEISEWKTSKKFFPTFFHIRIL